jgi:hypothetical protein
LINKSNPFIDLDNSEDVEQCIGGFSKFKNYFLNMTKRSQIATKYSIVSVMITYNSKHCITVLEHSDHLYLVRVYKLETLVFVEHAIKGKRIRVKDIEQNNSGDQFCLTYIDDGLFKLKVFDSSKVRKEFEINEAIGIDNSTVSLICVREPMINCCYVDNDTIFVTLFHNQTAMNWHFLYKISENSIVPGTTKSTKINQPVLNFPVKALFCALAQEIYWFYR